MTSLPGKLPQGFTGNSWEAAHVGPLCLGHTQSPKGQKKSSVQYQQQHLKKLSDTVGQVCGPGVLETLEFTVRYPEDCNSETGFFKNINIGHAVLLFPA